MACLNKRRRRRALFDMPLCAPRERPLQRRRSFPKNVFPFLPSLFLPTFSLIFFFVFFVVVLIHGFDSLPPRVCYYVAATAVVSACNQAVPSPRLHSHTHTLFPPFSPQVALSPSPKRFIKVRAPRRFVPINGFPNEPCPLPFSLFPTSPASGCSCDTSFYPPFVPKLTVRFKLRSCLTNQSHYHLTPVSVRVGGHGIT